MVKKIFLKLKKKGYIPPVVEKKINPNARIWNNVGLENWDGKSVEVALEGDSDLIPSKISEKGDKTILYCAQPKSASLYINKLLARTFQAKEHWIGFNKGSGELYFPRFLGALNEPRLTVSHCHAKADRKVISILHKTQPLVVVSYRNLADSLVSRRDMLVKDKYANEMLSTEGIRQFLNASPEEQLSTCIELYAQEFINFYVSWKQVASRFDVFFINYDKFITNQKETLHKLSQHFFNRPLSGNSETVIHDIMNSGGINFNKGKKGRGKNELTNEHKDRILEIAKVYQLENSEYLGL